MDFEDCLPDALRGSAPTLTRVAAGLSGAGVYRVDAGGAAYILKLSQDETPLDDWQRRVVIQRAAATAGVAPAVVHVTEARRAVLSELVVDRGGGMAAFMSRPTAVADIGQTLRRVHDLPVPPGTPPADARALLEKVQGWLGDTAVPPFVRAAIDRALLPPASSAGRPDVLSHNDVNPTNMAFDGSRLVLLDWDSAALNDAYYDMASVAMFLRFDTATCLRLLSAHDGSPVTELPPRFVDDRRMVAALCGSLFLHLARSLGHGGGAGGESGGLAEAYGRLQSGALKLAEAEGRWQLGLALLRESLAL